MEGDDSSPLLRWKHLSGQLFLLLVLWCSEHPKLHAHTAGRAESEGLVGKGSVGGLPLQSD